MRYLPTTAEGVEFVQSMAKDIGKYAQVDDKDGVMLDSLNEMIEQVSSRERDFYNELGCGNYQGFLRRLDEIQSSKYDALLANGKIFQEYANNYRFPISSTMEDAIDDLEVVVNTLQGTETFEEVINANLDQVHERALELIRDLFKQEGSEGQKRIRTFGSKQRGTRVGLGRLTFQAENGRLNIDYEGDVRLSRGLLEKIRQLAINIQDKTQKGKPLITAVFLTKQGFKDDVIKTIKRECNNPVINKVLDQEGHRIDITRSYAGLKGFLGEVRSLSILAELFGGDVNKVQGTGPLKEVATKQSIAIDTLVKLAAKHYGFQVKNYTLHNNIVNFERHMNAVDFVNGRLCVTGDIKDILLAFFGSYQFNQPFTDPNLIARFQSPKMTVKEYEDVVYSKFSTEFQNFQDLFDSRMGNILRVGRSFSTDGEDGVFGEEKMYYNTMFFIEDKIVPSSVILTAIKEEIKNRNIDEIFKSEYSLHGGKAATPTLQSNYNKAHPNLNLIGAAQEARVSYNISLDVKGLVDRAIAGII